MKFLLRATLLVAVLSLSYLVGCEFLRWSVKSPNGLPPAAQAGADGAQAALDELTKGGAVAGAIALLFTSTKTILRLWAAHKATKA